MPLETAARYAVRMSIALTVCLAAALLAAQPDDPRPNQDAPAATTKPAADLSQSVIQDVMHAAGLDAWNDGTRLKFTYHVESNGQPKAEHAHDWNLKTGDDAVTSGGKTTTVNVWSYDAAKATDAEKAAFQQWTNDSYWLLMPLKLGDPGVQFSPMAMTKDMPPSKAMTTMSFKQVGLTPGDQYDLAIDMKTHRVTHWFYRPNANTKAGFSWEDYRDYNGLHLAADHKSDDGKTRIYFTGVEFTRK